jgi:hypothetical protein
MSDYRDEFANETSLARHRAVSDTGDVTCLKLPAGMKFWKPKEGLNTIDILPYRTGKGNPFAQEPGRWYYERTFWTYRNIGANPKISYVCPSKTFNERDPIQDFIREEARKSNANAALIKELAAKKRQIFLVFDHNEPNEGIQCWEYSYHNFGEQLNDTIKLYPESKGYDQFYFGNERGSTLEIGMVQQVKGTFKFLEAKRIDFLRRARPLDAALVNHGHCLDDFLVKLSYDALRRIFLQWPEDQPLPAADGYMPASGQAGDGQTGQSSGQTEQRQEQRSETRQEQRRESPAERRETTTNETSAPQSRSSETKEAIQAKVIEMGRLAFDHGDKASSNPYHESEERFGLWAKGWMAGMAAKEQAIEKAPDKQADTKRVTVAELGLQKRSKFVWRGSEYEFSRAEDDVTLAGLDVNDELVKGIPASEVSVQRNGAATKSETTANANGGNGAAVEGSGGTGWDKDWPS